MPRTWLGSSVPASHWTTTPSGRAPLSVNILSGIPSGEHFSPAENLEQLNLGALASATQSIDLSMYAFTDLRLARELIGRARHGVVVRIYRDGEQFEEERERSSRYGWVTTTALFRGQLNIHVRVKPPSRWFIQYLKAYCVDERLLRDGSANFSRAGEEWEDDSAYFQRGPGVCSRFEEEFVRHCGIEAATSSCSDALRNARLSSPAGASTRARPSGVAAEVLSVAGDTVSPNPA
jgi:phosphatidylserine/phosphatidylglycerophosphate/cardiolipin synthase-like enzyme